MKREEAEMIRWKNNRSIVVLALIIIWLTASLGLAREVRSGSSDEVDQLVEQLDFSKQSELPKIDAAPVADPDQLKTQIITDRNKNSFWIVILLLITMFISNVSLLYYIKKCNKFSADDIMHASGLVFVIFGTILIIVIADTDQQMTASIGIMGAVAGYLFGTMTRTKEAKQEKN